MSGNDTLVIHDGSPITTPIDSVTSAGPYSEVITFATDTLTLTNLYNTPSTLTLTNLSVGLLNNKPNAFDVYDLIPLNTDASTVTFKDSTLTPISLAEKNYYIEAVSIGHAYLAANVDYICPVPKPHTCYYDYSGLTINMATAGITDYYDETGQYLIIEQSKYYGYSKNTATT